MLLYLSTIVGSTVTRPGSGYSRASRSVYFTLLSMSMLPSVVHEPATLADELGWAGILGGAGVAVGRLGGQAVA